MTRADVAEIRARLSDPRQVAALLGLRGERQRAGVLVQCVSHADRGPSLSLTRGRDGTLRVRCFGCPLAGDVFSLVAATRGLDLATAFPAVVAECLSLAALPAPDVAPMRPEVPPISAEVFDAIARDLLAPGLVGDVAAYVGRRRLFEDARAEGWASLPYPSQQPRALAPLRRRFGDAALLGSGLVCERDDAPGELRMVRPGARLLIPWRGRDGSVLSLQRRRVDDGSPRYVATRGRPLVELYGVDRVAGGGGVVYVEGAVDTLAMRVLLRRRGRRADVLGLPGIETWRRSLGAGEVHPWAAYAAGRVAYVAIDAGEQAEAVAVTMAADLAPVAVRVVRWRCEGGDWADAVKRASSDRPVRPR